MLFVLTTLRETCRYTLLLSLFLFVTSLLTAQDCSTALTINQNQTFTTQSELDAFVNADGARYECVRSISLFGGDVNDPITDITNLQAIRHARNLLIADLNGTMANLSLPQLQTVSSSVILRENGFQEVQLPRLAEVGNSLEVSELSYTLHTVAVGEQAEVLTVGNGALRVQGFSATQMGIFMAPSLVSVGGEALLGHQAYDGVGAQYFMPALEEVGDRFLAYGSVRVLSMGTQDLTIGGDFNIHSNSELALLSSGPLEVKGDLSMVNNNSTFNFDLDLYRVGSDLSLIGATGGVGSEVDLPNLSYVGGNISIFEFCAGNLDLSGLNEIAGNLHIWGNVFLREVSCGAQFIKGGLAISSLNGTVDNEALNKLDFPQLTTIGEYFWIADTKLLRTLAGFSALTTIGNGSSIINIADNELLAACCLLPCQVSLNGEPVYNGMPNLIIIRNNGDCRAESVLFAACADVPTATWTTSVPTPSRPFPSRPIRLYTPDYHAGTSYLWTLNGEVVGTQRILTLADNRAYLDAELCLTVTNETCGETTHCEDIGDDRLSGLGLGNLVGGQGGRGKALTQNTPAYPNPFTEKLTIVPAKTVTTVELIDALGRRIRRQPATKSSIVFTTDDLPAGLYFLQEYDAQGELVQMQKVLRR